MIRTVAETGSTNADLLRDAGALTEGTWLRAERQTGGRGRLGRVWESPPGNLYASTLVRLVPSDPDAPTLALVAAIAVHVAASAWVGATALHLKWPNDLLTGDAKLAGILLERSGNAVVIGFGVNLAAAPEGTGRPVSSLAAIVGSAPDPGSFCEDLARAFADWLGHWRAQGIGAIRQGWLERAHPIGTALAAQGADGGRRDGLFEGLSADGALLLRRADGSIETIRAGDVFLL